MSQPTTRQPDIVAAGKRRGSFTTIAGFLVGLPVGIAVVMFVLLGPVDESYQRYLEHPVEKAEVILFCCALGMLLAKLLACRNEKRALRAGMLPPWDGKPISIDHSTTLQQSLVKKPPRFRHSLLGRRLSGLIGFVQSRGTAQDLDDQVRALADAEFMAQEGSFSTLRLITWALPIMGFLGTVLGITKSITGVTPEILEQNLGAVTNGLAEAFDTTALALFLTMILMFFSSLVEQLEVRLLTSVDDYIETEFVHRFERLALDSNPFVATLQQNTAILLQATEKLVEGQAGVWAKSLEKADRAWTGAGQQQADKMTAALTDALEKTLSRHNQRMVQLEEKLLARNQALVDGIAMVAETLSRQADALARLQEGESQLARLQESLNQNLAALSGSGAFEEAVQSLTAAIHLLTMRAAPQVAPKLAQRPAA
ncbi:MAG: MotA/TolQ/ExbB proton channel family protein [Planctomycetes bacterium]|nr:MotA/TolQ/ExbB proton channel family protein [Planctomycetota bacterium]